MGESVAGHVELDDTVGQGAKDADSAVGLMSLGIALKERLKKGFELGLRVNLVRGVHRCVFQMDWEAWTLGSGLWSSILSSNNWSAISSNFWHCGGSY